MTTMRNYRQIMKTDAAGVALGGNSCRAVRDRIRFRLNIIRITLRDSVIGGITDTIQFNHVPDAPRFLLSDQLQLTDMIDMNMVEDAPKFSVQDSINNLDDEINFQEE